MAVPQPVLGRRLEAFASACRRQGLKATHQRMEIFQDLAGSREHPDAETVYRRVRARVRSISRDTVYRTLATLEQEGLIRRAAALGGPTRYDANMDRHHHFVCKVCGLVKDFYSDALDRLPIPKTVAALGRVEDAQVQVRGVCAACVSARARRKRKTRQEKQHEQ